MINILEKQNKMEHMIIPLVFILCFIFVIGYGINCDYKVKMKKLELIEKGIIKNIIDHP